MEDLRGLATRLDLAGETLAGLSRTVTSADPAQAAFGADTPGRPGEIGRALHRQWTAATGDRAREAHTAAHRLAAAASAVREAADRYTEVDRAARRRLAGES
ncbi:hypothetical protein [Micromonospora endolithica]|uniref:ESX-1 secretion-associated protein n=1 Tax=Micromonospora endolithica TaxID=230091 RepID=A0A3A9ZM84_9ACTN|nr:hypothetical protein [Micromonospora endolithica]RKN48437.1 hypothetical protein D7223_10575 [Micromonospora endolithica]TWJ24486.1 hypothetical protein JD76_04637 [Micromonospora endolithica]